MGCKISVIGFCFARLSDTSSGCSWKDFTCYCEGIFILILFTFETYKIVCVLRIYKTYLIFNFFLFWQGVIIYSRNKRLPGKLEVVHLRRLQFIIDKIVFF